MFFSDQSNNTHTSRENSKGCLNRGGNLDMANHRLKSQHILRAGSDWLQKTPRTTGEVLKTLFPNELGRFKELAETEGLVADLLLAEGYFPTGAGDIWDHRWIVGTAPWQGEAIVNTRNGAPSFRPRKKKRAKRA